MLGYFGLVLKKKAPDRECCELTPVLVSEGHATHRMGKTVPLNQIAGTKLKLELGDEVEFPCKWPATRILISTLSGFEPDPATILCPEIQGASQVKL